jgi:hypothetical protein
MFRFPTGVCQKETQIDRLPQRIEKEDGKQNYGGQQEWSCRSKLAPSFSMVQSSTPSTCNLNLANLLHHIVAIT